MHTTKNTTIPKIGSRWVRADNIFDPEKGQYNGYIVLAATNTSHKHPNHSPQVIYRGDNKKLWSLPVSKWPGNLKGEKP